MNLTPQQIRYIKTHILLGNHNINTWEQLNEIQTNWSKQSTTPSYYKWLLPVIMSGFGVFQTYTYYQKTQDFERNVFEKETLKYNEQQERDKAEQNTLQLIRDKEMQLQSLELKLLNKQNVLANDKQNFLREQMRKQEEEHRYKIKIGQLETKNEQLTRKNAILQEENDELRQHIKKNQNPLNIHTQMNTR